MRLAYDGAAYHGFARQGGAGEGLATVQGELERALAKLYKGPIETRGASRTDAGVHAWGQLVAFDPPFSIPARGLLLGLASQLPADIVAVAAWEEAREGGAPVQPRFENHGKRYRYRLRCGRQRNPWTAGREWQLPGALDVARMREAAAHFVGRHDFASFRASACQASTTIRVINQVDVRAQPLGDPYPEDDGRLAAPRDGTLEIDVVGEAFLHNMVRIMVGTLVEVGRGQRAPASIQELLARPDRRAAGTTAPARGLTLVEVLWRRGDDEVPKGTAQEASGEAVGVMSEGTAEVTARGSAEEASEETAPRSAEAASESGVSRE